MSRTIASDHGDKRASILRNAAILFAEEGYGRASMADVAKACGISKANIYHYYGGKDALLFDILENHLRFLRDRIEALEYPSTDPQDKLTFIMTEMLLAYQGADAEHDVLLNATRALPKAQQDILRQYQREFLGFGRKILAELVPDTIAQDKAKMRALTMSAFGMLNWHYKWNSDASEETRRKHAKMIAELVIGGVQNVS